MVVAATTPPSLWERWNELAPRLARGTLLACFDYDGTLVPIRATPAEAVADDATRDALRALAATPATVVAVVSGRPVAQLRELLQQDALWLVGLHGLEISCPGGDLRTLLDIDALAAALQPVRSRARQIATDHPGVLVEDKGASVALHTRQASREDAGAAMECFRAAAAGIDHFHLVPGKEVLELRPRGVDKGSAVRRLQAQAGGESILYVGDDTTDEDAFVALAGGQGSAPAAATVVTVRIAERDARDDARRSTHASCILGAQSETTELLRRLLALRRDRSA